MIVRSRAPLRIGLAGGGSDVSPYSDLYGGAILNGTISMYAYATIVPRDDGRIVIHAYDRGQSREYPSAERLEPDGELDLAKGVYNRVVRDFERGPLSFELTTWVDAPPGSGLGTSSTLVTAILGAFAEWRNYPLGHYDLAHLAYEIERLDLAMAGGKQDQYAATFGGINFMEFHKEDKVIVNPLRIKQKILDELAYNMLLYYTDTSRVSAEIIARQQENVRGDNQQSVQAMHLIKEQAVQMKEALLREELWRVGELLDFGYQQKQRMAEGIVTPAIGQIYGAAKAAGSSGGKISGAGGGGFMVFYCPGNTRFAVTDALKPFGGRVYRYGFVTEGLTTWKIK